MTARTAMAAFGSDCQLANRRHRRRRRRRSFAQRGSSPPPAFALFSVPFLLLLLLLSALPPLALSAGPALGEVDQIYFGVWVDSDVGFSDTPALFNARLQKNASVFHVAQKMPLPPYNYTTGVGGPAPEYLIENTFTDASVFLTVYPLSLTNLTDGDFATLGTQVMAYQKDMNRTVFLRWAPEMQGRWNPYGQQPAAFLRAWQTMYRTVKSIAPQTVVVWAPNLGHDYPYGQTENIAPEDLALLDTNKNGQLDYADDPYMPYYPGDDYVDWIGLSVYFKQFSRNINEAQPPGFCGDILTGIDTRTGRNGNFDWYTTFCANKPNKACLVAESGAAYHPTITAGNATQFQIQQAWWQDCITNATFFDRFPRIKLHMHFEFTKLEADIGAPDLRDYRLTNSTDVLSAFQRDLAAVQDRYLWAQYRRTTRPIQTSGPGIAAPGAGSGPTLVLQTIRNPAPTGLPTLFGTRASAAHRNYDVRRALALVGLTTVCIAGWEAVGRGRRRALQKRRRMSDGRR